MNSTYADMLCACANAPIKGQHLLLRALSLLLSSSLPCYWAPPSPGPPRLHRDWADGTSLDIVESVVVVTDAPPAPAAPALVFLAHWGFSDFTPFFLSHLFPPGCRSRLTSDSRFTEIKFVRLQGIWLCVLISSLGSYQNLPDIGSGHLLFCVHSLLPLQRSQN